MSYLCILTNFEVKNWLELILWGFKIIWCVKNLEQMPKWVKSKETSLSPVTYIKIWVAGSQYSDVHTYINVQNSCEQLNTFLVLENNDGQI